MKAKNFLIALVAVIGISTQLNAQGFSGLFDPANWVLTNPVGGSVNTAGAPASIELTGGDMSIAGAMDYTITYSGSCSIYLSFGWDVVHFDCGWDEVYYGINGSFTFLADCSASGGVGPFLLNPGDQLTFRVSTLDGVAGAPVLTVSAFSYSGIQPANWVTTNNNSNGTVDTSLAPCSVSITGSDNSSSSTGNILYSTTVAACSNISFDWSLSHPDCNFDDVYVIINSTPILIANCTGSGTFGPVGVSAGSTFGVSIVSLDNIGGAPTLTISNMYIQENSIPPTPDNASLTAVSDPCIVTTVTAPTATDACGSSVTGVPDVSFPLTYGTTITWTYTDAAGNISTQYQDVFITDVTPPVPDVASLAPYSEACSATPPQPSATDNCGGMVYVYCDYTFPLTTPGTTTVTWYYYDEIGNVTTQTQDITVTDDTDPSITAPADVNVSVSLVDCATDVVDTVIYYIPLSQILYSSGTYGLNCYPTMDVYFCGITGAITWNSTGTTTPSSVAVEYYQSYLDGSTNLTADLNGSAVADYVGPLNYCNAQIVTQQVSPAAYSVGGTNTLSLTGFGCWVWDENPDPLWTPASYARVIVVYPPIELGTPVVSDNCPGAVTVSSNAPSVYPVGTTVVTWTATDVFGNSATAIQEVVVTGPVVDVTVAGYTVSAVNTGAGVTYEWINCTTGLPIPGETSSSYTSPDTGGSYAVIVTEAGCSDTSECVILSGVGLAELSGLNILVYPNPSQTQFTIDSELSGTFEMLDVIGRHVMNGKISAGKNIVQITNLPEGSYTVRMQVEKNNFVTKRLMIVR